MSVVFHVKSVIADDTCGKGSI